MDCLGGPIVITSIFVRGTFDNTKGQGIMTMEAGIGVMLPGTEECPQPLDVEEVGNVFCLGISRSSGGEESACNAGDPGLVPGSGRSPGEGLGCPLQYPWASLVAQLVKNPPAVRENWTQLSNLHFHFLQEEPALLTP